MRYTPGRFGRPLSISRGSNSATASSALASVASGSSAYDFSLERADTFEDIAEHLRRQAAGVGVVPAAMIAVEQGEGFSAKFNAVPCPVRERMRTRPRVERAQHRIVRDAAQRKDRAGFGH